MMKNSTKTNLNLYDHLVRLLTKVMDERPENAVDVIEDMSRELKGSILQEKQDTLRDSPSSSSALLLAEQQKTLFTRAAGGEGDHEEELVDSSLPNVAELAFFFEQAGVGLGKLEMQRIFLALKQLVDTQCLQRCRFWGKILGTQSNYLVAEGEFREGEGDEEESTELTNEDEEREEEPQEDKDEAELVEAGRCVWVNITKKSADDVEEDAEEEEREEEPDEPEPEIGPPLLTPLSEDAKMNDTPPWSSMISSNLIPQFSIAVLRSNLWPGAYAYASGKNFGNVYIGWGLKYIGEAYTPIVLPPPHSEYPSGPEITEALDPSVEEEQALKAALEEQTVALEETEDLEEDEEEDDD